MKSNFIRCGVIGWGWELIYTSLHTLASPDFDHKLMGKTSLFMFPIYGSAALLKPVAKVVKKKPFGVRGSIYTCLIYGAEFITGKFLKKHDVCPWDYSDAKLNVDGVIRLDYAPGWFLLGLIYEKVLT